MNCTNCGAPVELVEGRGYFICEFCSTLRFPEADDSQGSEDGVTPLGQDTDWDCPVCHGMLEHATIEESRVHYCSECRGVLVDSDTFAAVIQMKRSRFSEADRAPTPLNPEDLQRKIRCSLCQLPMDVHPYYGPGNVVIDSCHRCHIVWLDHCEIAAIESAPGRR
jgi:Zn-finger nucleic acid-binding protein